MEDLLSVLDSPLVVEPFSIIPNQAWLLIALSFRLRFPAINGIHLLYHYSNAHTFRIVVGSSFYYPFVFKISFNRWF